MALGVIVGAFVGIGEDALVEAECERAGVRSLNATRLETRRAFPIAVAALDARPATEAHEARGHGSIPTSCQRDEMVKAIVKAARAIRDTPFVN